MVYPTPLEDRAFDVVICGGGLAGLTLARQLRRALPDLSVAVVEPTTRPLPAGAHKVGESSVELGSMYLEQLGLRDYLRDRHIVKFGLRFFAGGGHLPIEARDEIGPPDGEAFVSSYQLDRGVLESDLRAMIEADGATLLEGARVEAITLAPGDAPHAVRVQGADGASATLSARWVVDASGRRALLRRAGGLTRPAPHHASAGWFRLSGRFDITEALSETDAWRGRPKAHGRWRSTNHFMGPGYWVWVIPLAGGMTSIGIVAHASHHAFDGVRTLDRCMAFLEAHEPALAAALRRHVDGGEAVLDFRCIKSYSHDVERTLSADRWAIVGEAGAFVDPLYSPGTDLIALANCNAVELMRAERDGGDLAARAAELDAHYAAIVGWGYEIFEHAAPVYGYAPAMAAKYYWDNFFYWSYHCQFFARGIYRLGGEALAAFEPVRDDFRALNRRFQRLLTAWAEAAADGPVGRFVPSPGVDSTAINCHIALLNDLSPGDTLDYMALRLKQGRQMLAELTLRVLAELGPTQAAALIDATGLRDWGLVVSARRLGAAALEGKARRSRLGKVGRDLEDHLYPLRPHADAAEAMALLASA